VNRQKITQQQYSAGGVRPPPSGHVPGGPDREQVHYEASSLRHAVELAGERKRVLVVDDSAPFRRAAAELLRRRGYRVVGAVGSAAAARDAVECEVPDAVLMDVSLRDECGIELAAGLIRARPGLAVLLVSASDPPGQTRRVEASGASGFVLKSCLAAVPLERFFGAPSP
jgi:CheY-like chemotaxis protein